METKHSCSLLSLTALICAVTFQGVTCQDEPTTPVYTSDIKLEPVPALQGIPVRGDDILPTDITGQVQVVIFPTIDLPETTVTPAVEISSEPSTVEDPADQLDTEAPEQITTDQPDAEASVKHMGPVVCVDEATVKGKDAVKLKLKTFSSCEENKVKIQSVLEHLCGDDSKLEIYQQHHTDEMIISGQCIQADAKGMTEKINNDNIKDKIGVVEAVPVLVKHSRTVLISVLLAGLLLAALLIAAYILKTQRTQSKGVRLAEESFQVDEPNQGNTLLSVAPLPPQEPLDKPTSNGESPESPPTNGNSTTQTPVADTQM